MAAKNMTLPSPAEKRWGYRFGCDGIVSSEEARRLLGNICSKTLTRYAQKELIRTGYRIPGVPASGMTVCRRSLENFIAASER